MEKYNCEICGKQHHVYPRLQSPLPDLIADIPKEERKNRLNEVNGLYLIDKKWLLGNAYIQIEMEGLDKPIFQWQVWVTISPQDFQDNLENITRGEQVEVRGRLQSEIPFYSKSKNLKSKILIQENNESLLIEVKVDEESQLKNDQLKPITKERVIELMQYLNHNDLFKEKKQLGKNFSEKLRRELINAEDNYIKNNKGFVININSSNFVLFQIIHNHMLESNRKSNLGFGLHISFDQSFEQCREQIEKFKKQDYSNDFEYYNLDEIPTYQIDLGNDKDKIEKLIKLIIIDVYGQELKMIDMDNFET